MSAAAESQDVQVVRFTKDQVAKALSTYGPHEKGDCTQQLSPEASVLAKVFGVMQFDRAEEVEVLADSQEARLIRQGLARVA